MLKDAKSFKKKINESEIIIAPGAYDCLTAKVIEKSGFDAIYITGSGLSFTSIGKPDIGLMTLTEVANKVENIVSATNLPVIADIDTGFGNVINLIRTIEIFLKIGVAAVQLEDQTFPKKCGHYTGKTLITTEEMVGKIKAVKDVAGENIMLIARTDARTPFDINEAIRRAKIYEEAGADIIFIESPETKKEMELINKYIQVPTLVDMVEGGRTPFLGINELKEMGFKIAIYPNTITRTVLYSSIRVLKELKDKGTTQEFLDNKQMASFKELHEFFDLSKYVELEKKYLSH